MACVVGEVNYKEGHVEVGEVRMAGCSKRSRDKEDNHKQRAAATTVEKNMRRPRLEANNGTSQASSKFLAVLR